MFGHWTDDCQYDMVSPIIQCVPVASVSCASNIPGVHVVFLYWGVSCKTSQVSCIITCANCHFYFYTDLLEIQVTTLSVHVVFVTSLALITTQINIIPLAHNRLCFAINCH